MQPLRIEARKLRQSGHQLAAREITRRPLPSPQATHVQRRLRSSSQPSGWYDHAAQPWSAILAHSMQQSTAEGWAAS